MWGIYLDVREDEHPDDDNIDSEAEISLHALYGAYTTETMRLPVSVGSGSHHLDRLQLHSLLHGGSCCPLLEPNTHSQGQHDRGGSKW
jgi:hypothetical protein